ncbi:hypothetical protein Aperf_G00000113824 [Anoplocephala perfoliata]
MLERETFKNDFKTSSPSNWMAEPITPKDELFKTNDVRSKMELLCMDLQAHLCRHMEAIDVKGRFIVDRWMRKDGNGGGISCVLQDGKVFEKAGVNISVITSTLSESAIQQMKERLKDLESGRKYSFRVVGISSVNHPLNPHAPTMHFNFRYFEVINMETGHLTWWFGGGCDLTPSFLYEEDAEHFHYLFKSACDAHNPSYYPDFKSWCDRYFFLKHRNEARGVGGIFFDDLDSAPREKIFEFVRDCAAAVAPSYLPIIVKRMWTSYSDHDRQWQLIRRGRYVEFNLIHDRGTKFGLFTPEARIESIFVSMPLYAKWVYCHNPGEDKRHQKLLEVLTRPREWA